VVEHNEPAHPSSREPLQARWAVKWLADAKRTHG
jgi:hypothetical protein